MTNSLRICSLHFPVGHTAGLATASVLSITSLELIYLLPGSLCPLITSLQCPPSPRLLKIPLAGLMRFVLLSPMRCDSSRDSACSRPCVAGQLWLGWGCGWDLRPKSSAWRPGLESWHHFRVGTPSCQRAGAGVVTDRPWSRGSGACGVWGLGCSAVCFPWGTGVEVSKESHPFSICHVKLEWCEQANDPHCNRKCV